jgi:hypothetical protein
MRTAQQELRPPDFLPVERINESPRPGHRPGLRIQTSNRGREQWQHDFTRQRHRVQGGPWGPGSKVRTAFEDAHRFRKCASWKIPTIPSKMRTLFQGAHQKVSIFAARHSPRPSGPLWAHAFPSTPNEHRHLGWAAARFPSMTRVTRLATQRRSIGSHSVNPFLGATSTDWRGRVFNRLADSHPESGSGPPRRAYNC